MSRVWHTSSMLQLDDSVPPEALAVSECAGLRLLLLLSGQEPAGPIFWQRRGTPETAGNRGKPLEKLGSAAVIRIFWCDILWTCWNRRNVWCNGGTHKMSKTLTGPWKKLSKWSGQISQGLIGRLVYATFTPRFVVVITGSSHFWWFKWPSVSLTMSNELNDICNDPHWPADFFREIDTTTNQMFFVIVKHHVLKSNHHFLDG